LDDYRITSRGGKGVKTVNVTERTGSLVCMRSVEGNEDCLIMTDQGIMIRISLEQVPVLSRAAQGVKAISVKDDTKVSAVSIIEPEPEETAEEETETDADSISASAEEEK
jgi:DNA gyrase subunit A